MEQQSVFFFGSSRPPVRQVIKQGIEQPDAPRKQKNKHRFLITFMWNGQEIRIWRHAQAKTMEQMKHKALCSAIQELAKRVGYNACYVYQYITSANTNRYEVREL